MGGPHLASPAIPTKKLNPRRGAAVVGRRYHFHTGGLVYAVTTIVLVIGAVNGQQNLLFILFGLGVAGLIISGVISGGSLLRLSVEREPVIPPVVGDDIVIRYRLTNRSRFFGTFAITIEEIEKSKRGGSTWARHISRPVAFCAYIPARASVVVEARVRARSRGLAVFGPLSVSTSFPFGLTRKSVIFYQHMQLLIRPWSAPIKPGLVQRAGGSGDSGGKHRRSRTGDEFFSLREYAQGDSLRSVAWRSTARLDNAVVRDMAVRPSRKLWVIPAFSADPRANEQAISVAASLVQHAAAGGFEVGLVSSSGRIMETPHAGSRHAHRLLDVLAVYPTEDVGGRFGDGRAGAIGRDSIIVVAAPGSAAADLPGRHLIVDDPSLYAVDIASAWHPDLSPKAAPKVGWFKTLMGITGGRP